MVKIHDIDTGHGKKYGTKNTAQLRFFDPPAPPYVNVGTKRMTVKIRSMNNLTPFQSQGVTTRLIFSLFYD